MSERSGYMNIWIYLLEFVVAVILVLLYYKLIETKGIKRFTKNNIPVDVKLFIHTQKVDMKKIKYKTLMRIVAITNAIDIAIVLLITNVTDSFIVKLAIAIPSIIGILLISYWGVGRVLKMKGLTTDES